MKIQFIFFAVCVLTSFALPERRNFGNRHSELTDQREQELERQNTNRESSNAGDEFIDVRDESVDEKTISPNEMTTEKSKCGWISRSQNNARKHWLKKHEGERRHRNNGAALSNEEHQHPFFHTTIWQEKQTLFPEANLGAETRHHHRHHHHHHHRNCTTTVPPTTTAATNTPSSEIEE